MSRRNSHHIISNPDLVLYTDKQRPVIFTEVYKQKNKRKTFDDLYESPIFKELSFLINNQYNQCSCINSLKQCPKFKDILKHSRKEQAKIIFDRIKQQCKPIHQEGQFNKLMLNEVFRPHYLNLFSVIQCDCPQAVIQILKHAKIDYLTFWIYGLFCSKLPSLQTVMQNIRGISLKLNLDIDLQKLFVDQKSPLQQIYRTKLFYIFPSCYPVVASLIINSLKSDMIIEKLIICKFIRGRQRKQLEVIKAAIQMTF